MSYLKKSVQFILDAFFPTKCLICGEEGTVLCPKHQYIPENKTRYSTPGIDKIQARTHYHHQVSKRLVRQFKFHHQKEIAKLIAQEIQPLINKDFTLAPIPLHWSRKMFRGFNQSELIVKELQKLNPSIKTVNSQYFKRVKNTHQQALLNKNKRAKNLQKAFRWTYKIPPPEKILLIDDIMTSGATLSAAAKTLKKAGTKHLQAVVFAHG